MGDSPTTRQSLLVRIRDKRDGPAWAQFVELYAPLIYGFARKHGLQDADAADLTQDVLRSVAGATGESAHDPGRGSFRGWLFTIVRNTLRNFHASGQRRGRGGGDTAIHEMLAQQPAPQEDSDFWEREHERRLFAWAAERVRREVHATTWEAFRQTAVEGKEPADVAKQTGMTVANVYLAKGRVMARLKAHVRQWRDDS
jgi:RNA polymerase sigma-70 factor (ECF subfamily)